MDPYQHQLDALTLSVEGLGGELEKHVQRLNEQNGWLLARVELLNALLLPLLANADPTTKGMAIAAAQVKGEQIQEQGPPTIAENYARLLAGIVAS